MVVVETSCMDVSRGGGDFDSVYNFYQEVIPTCRKR